MNRPSSIPATCNRAEISGKIFKCSRRRSAITTMIRPSIFNDHSNGQSVTNPLLTWPNIPLRGVKRYEYSIRVIHVWITTAYLYVYSISMAAAMEAACQINSEYLISRVTYTYIYMYICIYIYIRLYIYIYICM